jgi:VanZ family protein
MIMKTERIINRIFLILTLLVMALIFFFSTQNGESSSETSSRVVRIILSLFVRGFGKMGESEQAALISEYSHIVRKAAHFSEFAALGFCFSVYLSTRERKMKILPRGLVALVFSALYALSDEAHQMLSDGRGPSLIDSAIDTAGAFTGIIIALLICYLIEIRRK